MKKSCPPGVFCIENYTLLLITILLIICIFFIYKFHKENSLHYKESNKSNSLNSFDYTIYNSLGKENNVLMNPHDPPLRDNRYNKSNNFQHKIPINISTRAVESKFRQIGILTRVSGKETILPLMGRPLYPSRDKWLFYTLSDQNNRIKLPISYKKKSCMNQYGCYNLYNGDIVYVEGYNDAFKVTSYDNNTLTYIPVL